MTALAYIFAVLKNVVYGSSVFFTGNLTETVDVPDVLALRFLMSFVFLWILKLFKVINIKVGVKDFFQKGEKFTAVRTLLLTAIFEPVLYMTFETLGISMTTGVTAGVILSLSAVSTCIFEIIFLKEKSTFLQKVFLLLGIIGAVYIAVNTNTTDGNDTVLGIIFLFLTVLSGSMFLVFSRKSSKNFGSLDITYVSSMLGAIAFNLFNVIRHIVKGDIIHYFDPYFSIQNIIGFMFLAILSTVIATIMNNFALARMQTSTMAAFGGISTLVTVAVGVIFGGDTLQTFHIIGLTLIVIRMIGVSWIAISRSKKESAFLEGKR